MEHHKSPFRSELVTVRRKAAERMIELAEDEMARCKERRERLAKLGHSRKSLLHFGTRIRALENNIRSWADYLKQGCPREGRATTIPGVTR